MLANLLNVDKGLVEEIAEGLGLTELPPATEPAVATRQDLKPSPSLSILQNGPDNFQGRRLGVLASEGADSTMLDTLEKAAEQEGAEFDLVTPTIGGIHGEDGTRYYGDGALSGTPSVLFDAVAIVVSQDGAKQLAKDPAARDFIADAVAHKKFIAYVPAAESLLLKVSGLDSLDEGFIALNGSAEAVKFLETCRKLRFWDRE
jgi:catalase